MAISGTRAKAIFAALLSLFLVFTLAFDAGAKDKKERRSKPQLRRVQAPGPWAAKRIIKAQEALAAEQWDEALEILQEMKDRKKLKGIEVATMWQFYGFIYSSRNPPDYKMALVAFEKALAPEALPDATQTATYMNVAQLYVMQERYDDALETFDKYFANTEEPSPDAYYMYAIALTQKGSGRKAIPWAIKAINASKNPKEPWLQLLSSLYFETKQYKKAIGVLEMLVTRFPKKNYFIQLAALNNEIGKEQRALAVLELAYHQNMLDQDTEYRNLAQLYLSQEIPYQAALVMQKGMRSGTVEKDRKAYDLISQAWLLAREREKAIAPLTKSAARGKNGEAYLRLAQLHLDVADWAAAEAALHKSLKKGGLKKPALGHILLGIAQFNQEDWEGAKDSFFEAREYEKSKETATQWLKQVGRHIPVDLDEDDDEEEEVIEMVDGVPASWYDLPAGDRAVLIGGLEAGIIKLDQARPREADENADTPAGEAAGEADTAETRDAASAAQPS
jgi:tetratricopeptide (TPR) repeat protein